MSVTSDRDEMALPDPALLKQQIEVINRFQAIVHECMVEGQDFGVIPGTDKPTLLKPGAEKISKLLGLADLYEIVDHTEDWTRPLFRYLIRCRLVSVRSGVVISEGLGECNSMESKYRWRDAKRKCPECGKEAIIKGKKEYGGGWLCYKNLGGCGYKWPDGAPEIEGQVVGKVENEDVYSVVNTILKMAEKRALVDAALHAGRLSNVFTQDIEDMPRGNPPGTERPAEKQNGQSREKAVINTENLRLTMKNKGMSDAGVVKWARQAFADMGFKDGITVEQLVEVLNADQRQKMVDALLKLPDVVGGKAVTP